MTVKRIFLCLVAALLLTGGPSYALAGDCPQAEELAQQAATTTKAKKALSLAAKAVKLCPQSATVLNNAGLAYERAGKLTKAEALYKKALKTKQGFQAPLAGLGDVAFRRGNFALAAQYYEKFLKGLGQADSGYLFQDSSNDQSAQHRAEYERRLKIARQNAGIHQDSLSREVGTEYLVRGLGARGWGGVRPRINLSSITFAYDSAKIEARGRSQLIKLAQALKDPKLAEKSFLIRGHTDTYGSQAYNLKLSKKRASAVRAFLVKQGVAKKRLKIEGVGESSPIIAQGSKEEQAPNRRVEFVNLGGKEYLK